jgi:hypothetical protein
MFGDNTPICVYKEGWHKMARRKHFLDYSAQQRSPNQTNNGNR